MKEISYPIVLGDQQRKILQIIREGYGDSVRVLSIRSELGKDGVLVRYSTVLSAIRQINRKLPVDIIGKGPKGMGYYDVLSSITNKP